jgi:hypothetical protein
MPKFLTGQSWSSYLLRLDEQKAKFVTLPTLLNKLDFQSGDDDPAIRDRVLRGVVERVCRSNQRVIGNRRSFDAQAASIVFAHAFDSSHHADDPGVACEK